MELGQGTLVRSTGLEMVDVTCILNPSAADIQAQIYQTQDQLLEMAARYATLNKVPMEAFYLSNSELKEMPSDQVRLDRLQAKLRLIKRLLGDAAEPTTHSVEQAHGGRNLTGTLQNPCGGAANPPAKSVDAGNSGNARRGFNNSRKEYRALVQQNTGTVDAAVPSDASPSPDLNRPLGPSLGPLVGQY